MVGYELGSYDFDASAKSVTFIGLGTVKIEQVRLITNVTTGDIIYNFADPSKKGVMSSNVLTLNYDTTPMNDTDKLQIDFMYNNSEDFIKGVVQTEPQSNPPKYKTDVIELVTDQVVTSTFDDTGVEISMVSQQYLGVWVTYTVNDSENVELKLLGKHTNGGSDEFEIDSIADKTIWGTGATNGKKYFVFDVGTIPYVQLQVKAGTVGGTAGTVTLYYNTY